MDEKEEIKMEQELQWRRYRQRILGSIEQKLLQMKELVEWAKKGILSPKELAVLNGKINNLLAQVNVLYEERRKTELEEIHE